MINKLKALIVDDEALACDMLDYLIQKNVPEIGQIKKCTSAAEGIAMLKTYQPDILFLDIQMPFMTGFDMLKEVSAENFSVIFTTAFDRYAIKAIRFSALDYLLKPVDADELKLAVERHVKQQKNNDYNKQYEFLKYNMDSTGQQHKLVLRDKNGVRFVHPSAIIYCEAINNYTRFHLAEGTTIVIAKTIKEYEEMLKEYGFIRTHKSYLVNAVFVKSVSPDFHYVILNDKTRIEISRRRKDDVVEFLAR